MGLLDELKKLTRPYEEDDDRFLDEPEVIDDQALPAKPARPNPFERGAMELSAQPQQHSTPRASRPKEGRVMNLNTGGVSPQMQVVLVKPERFEAAAEIADQLRNKRAVLVNLETTPRDVTRRLVDFLSGVTYAIDGNIRKVASNTYILTPPSVNLMGEELLGSNMENSGFTF